MSTTSYNHEYWPFHVSDAEVADPEFADKVAFLKAASKPGWQAYKSGINDYGAKSGCRSGIVLERGRNRWEVRLSQDEHRRLSAFVGQFTSAGNAVVSWLHGTTIEQILADLNEHLLVPPGLDESYKVYERTEE